MVDATDTAMGYRTAAASTTDKPNIKVKPLKKTRLTHGNTAKSEWHLVNHEQ